jgi:hypothetical protein
MIVVWTIPLSILSPSQGKIVNMALDYLIFCRRSLRCL